MSSTPVVVAEKVFYVTLNVFQGLKSYRFSRRRPDENLDAEINSA
ncbi:MAG: hypothetical protein ABIL46_06340 [candidate division WOR-3 bacterium]